MAAADGSDRRLWQRLCTELELPRAARPPEHGGLGATLVETAIAAELGRALTPPFAPRCLRSKRFCAWATTSSACSPGSSYRRADRERSPSVATTSRRLPPFTVRRDGRGPRSPARRYFGAARSRRRPVRGARVLTPDRLARTWPPTPPGRSHRCPRLTSPVRSSRSAGRGSPAEPLTAGTPDDMERALDARVLLAEMLALVRLDLAVQYAGRRNPPIDRSVPSRRSSTPAPT